MRISSLEEYGLRVGLCLARSPGESLSAAEVARREGLSSEYAGKILHLLKKAKLVAAQRGAHGGFRLAREASKISIASLFLALAEKEERSSAQEFCQTHSGVLATCVHSQRCSVQPLWKVLFEGFDKMLEEIFLEDLLMNQETLKIKMKDVATRRLESLFEARI